MRRGQLIWKFIVLALNKENLPLIKRPFLRPTSYPAKQNKKNNISCIDGFSKIRLIKVFNFLDSLNKIYCRKAIIQDAKIYFEWANDISVRANAINNDPIEYKNHIQWFTQKIMNDKSVLYYFEFDKHPLGQVRFDFDNEKAIIDYSVDKQFRNKGLGQVILYNAIYSLYEEGYGNGEILLFAQVKQSNISSIKVFNNLNFKQVGIQTIGDVNYYNFQK